MKGDQVTLHYESSPFKYYFVDFYDIKFGFNNIKSILRAVNDFNLKSLTKSHLVVYKSFEWIVKLINLVSIQNIFMSHPKIIKNQASKSDNNIELPYLPNPSFKHNIKKKQFDLRLNNISLPKYDPLRDKNLKYFFEKDTVKKRIGDIPEVRRNQSKTTITEASRGRISSGSMRQVSKIQFMNYIDEIRKKIKTNKL